MEEKKNNTGEVINCDRGQLERAIVSRQYDARTVELLRWLHGYAISQLGSRKADLLNALGGSIDWPTIYRAMTGADLDRADMDNLLALIDQLKIKIDEVGALAFAETPVTVKIRKALNYAREHGAMVMISGPSGRSKTSTALQWAAENNHGRTIYVRATSGSSKRTIVQAIARAIGIGAGRARNCGMGELEQRIRESIGAHNVFIFDEVGHLFPAGNRGTEGLDFLRDLHDLTKCGMALIATEYYYETLDKGRHAVFFEQFIGRLKLHVNIPRRIFKGEIEAACKMLIKSPSADLIAAVWETAKVDKGHLRPIIQDDLPMLAKLSKRLGKAPCREMWTEVVNYRRTAGAEEWPEE
jgi:DNA transposition AAA+ family ATPase